MRSDSPEPPAAPSAPPDRPAATQRPLRVVVLVPRREDGGRRDMLWFWLLARWRTLHPTWLIFEGHHLDGPFNRSAAINRAAADAGVWDVAVIADADTIVPAGQVAEAVELAHTSQQLVFAFDRYCALDETGTTFAMDGYTGSWEPFVIAELAHTASSCIVVPRPLFDELGGFDERFVGWGFEDAAFSMAAQTIGEGCHRVAGTAWHLWHEPAEGTGDESSPIWQANHARAQPYLDAFGDVDAMRSVLAR